jgi:Asp-tRNA(Asn)/Glu-tRNA(Gln) amidotransferase A subunit family amidase
VHPFASATEWLAELRAGTVTPSELTDFYISRIAKYDTRLNAVVVRDFERAREAARAASHGGPGVLRGLPMTLRPSPQRNAAAAQRAVPDPAHAEPAVVMGVQGPLARSAEDLELALSVLAGPEIGEDVARRGAAGAPRAARRIPRRHPARHPMAAGGRPDRVGPRGPRGQARPTRMRRQAIGLQAIGPYLEDRTPIRFAALLAKEIGGVRRVAGPVSPGRGRRHR